jgi:hypothetical protein
MLASPPMLSSIYPQHRWKMENLIRVSLEQESTKIFVSPYLIATLYATLGDKDAAFKFLEKAYAGEIIGYLLESEG